MLSYVKKIIGDRQQRELKRIRQLVEQINAIEQEIEQLTDEQLKNKTAAFKEQLQSGATVDSIMIEAFAVVREAAKRVLGQRHYDVQLMGGIVLSEGNIAEMATGEGKTLVASLPSYLRALEGKGVHVITVNEYLAKRDRDMIGQVHEFLGLTVGLNIPLMNPAEKKAAYQADITYGIGSEFGFDFLRDNMVYNKDDKVQRPYHFAIIDEIDSVLIDEAKTPLIIAGKTKVSENLYYICAKVVKSFKKDEDYLYDPLMKAASLTDNGVTKVERAFGIDNLYDLEHQTLYHFILQALRAKVMFQRDVDYIVSKDELKLVDMFTGRIMEGRSFSEGLHQALEAKEGIPISEENKTQATVTVQNYFRMYPTLSGMTGTAKTEEKEFASLYGMDVIQIPTNRPKLRIDREDKIFATSEAKYEAVANEVKKRYEKGQPILVGTASIIQSETMANYLNKLNIPHELLNAKSVESEVKFITMAGQKGQVTIATNMAGRGTDIMLGEGVAELGGLFVLGTERHESRRIDNQLKGRSGRQGDPGESQFYISLEDEMLQRFGEEEIEKFQKSMKTDEEGLILNKDVHELIDKIQQKCENNNFSIREYTLKLDDVVNEQRNVLYTLRNKVLEDEDQLSILIPMIKASVKHTVESICMKELLPEEWEIETLSKHLQSLAPLCVFELANQELQDQKEVLAYVEEQLETYLEELETMQENEMIQANCRSILLSSIDFHWLHHMEDMARLKEGIGLRGYSQEDPMRVYQREGFELFKTMYEAIESDAAIRFGRTIKQS